MSGKVLGWAMGQKTGSPTTKLVLAKLADNANDDGICWPRVALIAEHTELCERAVRKHLKRLEDSGLIQVEKRLAAAGQTSNVYRLDVPWLNGGTDKSAPPPTFDGRKGAAHPLHDIPNPAKGDGTSCRGRVKLTTEQPARHAPLKEPSLEPSLNLQPVPAQEELAIGTGLSKSRADALARQIGEEQFNCWFAKAEIVEGPPPMIVVPTPFMADWITNRFGTPLRRVFGEDVHVIPAPPGSDTDSSEGSSE